MPKRSNAFQTVVAQIQKMLADHDSYGVEESALLTHVITGESREVDVVVTDTVAGVPITISFECTSQKRRAGSQWVEGMLKKHEHLTTNFLILVSESGFTRPALDLTTSHERVEAITLEEAASIDWALHFGDLGGLRFCGYEFEPTEFRANWLTPNGLDDSGISIDASTRLIKISTGDELDPHSFCIDLLRNEETVRRVSARYLADKQVSSLDNQAAGAIGAEGEIELAWTPAPGTWVIRLASEERVLTRVQVKAAMAIKDSPIELTQGSFRGTNVAHATIDQPYVNKKKNRGDEIVLVFAETKDGDSTASAAYIDPKLKHKEMRFKHLKTGDKD